MVFSAGARTDPLVRWIHSHRVVTLWSRKPACRILKQMETMKTLRIFSMAALVLVMAACTSSDIEIPQQDGKIHFTAKIAAPNSGSATKTVYTVNGTTINVAWRAKEEGVYEGDKIALIHNGEKDIATVTAVDGSGNATIEATITGEPEEGDDVVLVYPAASVNATGSGTGFTPDETYALKGFAQDGTLDYISTYLDGRQGSGKLSVSGATATLKGSVKMDSQIAIWKLTLQDNSATPNALSASAVTVTVGTTPVAAASALSATSEYYLCLVPAAMSSGNLTISATVGSDTYSYTKEGGVTLVAGKYYQSTVTMTKVPSYDRTVNINDGETDDITVTANQHWLIEGNGTAVNRTIIIDDGATVTIAGVNIKAENTNAIKCLGSAEIVLSGTNIVTSESNSQTSGTLNYAVIKAGTYEPTKTTLTISGDGTLNANPVYHSGATSQAHNGAVIGADYEGNCGNIVINSGTIKVSTNYGAAIGSGRVSTGTSKCGGITINGGTINATGSTGAGIGSGGRMWVSANRGTTSCDGITITGGTVTARSVGGAAIGAGKCEGGGTNSDSYCGDILITGGTVDARTSAGNNADGGAAIGGGYHSKAGTITISGGNVTAVGSSRSAGIGSGSRNSQCGNILINGGSVDAQGGYNTNDNEGAGIGTGRGSASNAKSICGTITITNTVTIVKAYNVKGSSAKMNIGKGSSINTQCGAVTIPGVSGTGGVAGGSRYTYQPGAGS